VDSSLFLNAFRDDAIISMRQMRLRIRQSSARTLARRCIRVCVKRPWRSRLLFPG